MQQLKDEVSYTEGHLALPTGSPEIEGSES